MYLAAAELKRGAGRWSSESSLEELALLADTAGARVAGKTGLLDSFTGGGTIERT